jgi:hypothetical protein
MRNLVRDLLVLDPKARPHIDRVVSIADDMRASLL